MAVCGTDKRPGCGAPIIWAKTMNGKSMPLDASPVEVGTHYIDSAGTVREAKNAPADANQFTAHWATCPVARNFRRPKR